MTRSRSGTITREFRISDLLAQIAAGEIVLPEFQRDFDWGDDRVAQLLATVVRRWPAGSLLLQQFTGDAFYRLRAFDGGPPVDEGGVEYTVLDGQQRLTALYHAIYDSGQYVFAIRASALEPDNSIEGLEDGIASFTRKDWDSKHRDLPWSLENDWIPFYALKSAADFFAWRDDALRRGHVGGVFGRTDAAQVSEAYRRGLESFHSYMIPAVIVERDLEPEAVARIFERVNRGGLRLSAFDLMVAKTFEPGWNLRDKWASAREEHSILDTFFSDDGMPIVRVIAMRTADSVREGDVLRLAGLAVRQDWDASIDAMAHAVRFVSERCGVHRPEFMPYSGMLISLAGLALEVDLFHHAEVIEGWFWNRAFGLSYEGGANTRTVDEYHHLRSVVKGQSKLRLIPISSQVVLEATRKRRSALWRAFMAALSSLDARDPITGEAVGGSSAAASHIVSPMNTPAGEESPHLRMLNLILMNTSTRRLLSGAGIDKLYFELGQLPNSLSDAVRDSQLLPDHSLPIEGFLDARLSMLEEFLRRRTGRGFDYGDLDPEPFESRST